MCSFYMKNTTIHLNTFSSTPTQTSQKVWSPETWVGIQLPRNTDTARTYPHSSNATALSTEQWRPRSLSVRLLPYRRPVRKEHQPQRAVCSLCRWIAIAQIWVRRFVGGWLLYCVTPEPRYAERRQCPRQFPPCARRRRKCRLAGCRRLHHAEGKKKIWGSNIRTRKTNLLWQHGPRFPILIKQLTLCVSWNALIKSCTKCIIAPCSLSGAWLAGQSAKFLIKPMTALTSGQRDGGLSSFTITWMP